MQTETRCPYQACLHVFACGETTATCPQCGRRFTPHPLDILGKLDRAAQEHLSQNSLANRQALDQLLTKQTRFVAAAEDVRSLWNVGSIFRSADGAGIELLFLVGITGTPPRKQIEKTSLGAQRSVAWLYSPNITDLLAQLKERGFFLLGLEYVRGIAGLPDSYPLAAALRDKLITTPACLLVGNEVSGLSRQTLELCDRVCHLPMRGTKESLNVAVAFGIAAYMLAEAL